MSVQQDITSADSSSTNKTFHESANICS